MIKKGRKQRREQYYDRQTTKALADDNAEKAAPSTVSSKGKRRTPKPAD
jgi:hypothetical protein